MKRHCHASLASCKCFASNVASKRSEGASLQGALCFVGGRVGLAFFPRSTDTPNTEGALNESAKLMSMLVFHVLARGIVLFAAYEHSKAVLH